ncbi:MAG TPA: 1,4-alpha-glucan branching enzyme, partial [Phaeodactylibacter sp.]|nr:1,4-alpha-glucan branching enzyme [Phaeodactylibacter sp.]
WVQTLNKFYKSSPALYEKAFEPEGFEWVDYQDRDSSILSFLRKGKDAKKPLLVVCNFTPAVRTPYKVGVPLGGKWKEVLNSDATTFSGSGIVHDKTLTATKQKEKWQGRDYALELRLAPLAIMVFEKL